MENKEEPTKCYELAQMSDFQEILEHEMLGCPTCLRIKKRNSTINNEDHSVKPVDVRLALAPASNAQVKPNERKRRTDSDDSSEFKKTGV
uniref:Uncharacterized protein n=1 Tax=Ditylenchus dipsaci TaxID=166011 RepID=A0A915EE16_9BILA